MKSKFFKKKMYFNIYYYLCVTYRESEDDYILIIFSIKRFGRTEDIYRLFEMNHSLRYLLKIQFQGKKT